MTDTPILLRRREALGLTQEAVARLVGIERAYLSRVERGLTMPGTGLLISLCRALQLSPEEREELEAQLVPLAPVDATPADVSPTSIAP